MCGLVGVITKGYNGFTKDQVDLFDTLLFADQLRGMDSTGVFLVDKEGNVDIAKEASHSTEFRSKKEYKEVLEKAFRRGAAIIGHNRAATKGDIVDENAHPFTVDDKITLVHNGTLWGDHKRLADTEVDSHAIAHVIHQHGDNVEAALQELSGAFALIWHDFTNNTINMVRNTQRPLHYVETPQAYLWASESNMLFWMLARFNLKPEGEIKMLPDGTLVTYKMVNGRYVPSERKISFIKPYTPSEVVDDYEIEMLRRYGNHPYANANDEDFEDINSCVLPQPQGRMHATPPNRPLEDLPANHTIMERGNTIEEQLAFAMTNHFTFQQFENVTGQLKIDDFMCMICTDVTEISPKQPSLGYYLYGKLEKEPRILVRVHMPPSTSEMELLDWSLNGKRILFTYRSKLWRSYREQAHIRISGDGYGIFQGAHAKELKETALLLPTNQAVQ